VSNTQTPSERRTDGQTRTATTSTAIAAATPCRRRCDSWQTDERRELYSQRPSVRLSDGVWNERTDGRTDAANII